MEARIRALAEQVWRYHQLNHQLASADVILVLCSHDKAVAERGAQLFLEGWAPLLIFAGGLAVALTAVLALWVPWQRAVPAAPLRLSVDEIIRSVFAWGKVSGWRRFSPARRR